MITPEYKELNRLLHTSDETYGISGYKYADPIRLLSDYGRKSILDYGAGKCTLKNVLGPAYKVICYDPCIEELSARPPQCDLVACTDVMEHVEPQFVDEVLKDIRSLAKERAIFSISVVPAHKTLADGRNAHISLMTVSQWVERVEKAGFTVESKHDTEEGRNTFGLICT